MAADLNNRGATLYAHILALERLQEAKDEARDDYNMRMKLAVEDDFDRRAIAAILKRRKAGAGPSETFDDNVRVYEDMIRSAAAAPLSPDSVTITIDQPASPAGSDEGVDF